MFNQFLFLQDQTLFAVQYNRVVRGERGDYIEFEKEHILLPLFSRFINNDLEDLVRLGCYYQWLFPAGHENIKVYFQLKAVKYADYIPGKYYVSVTEFKDFKDPEKLF